MGRVRFTLVSKLSILLLVVLMAVVLLGCSDATMEADVGSEAPEIESPEVEQTEIILASTTSTQDSGLFDVLIPAFHEAYPEYIAKVVAVGTGEALTMGENKDADVLLVHAKSSEGEFVADGFGIERKDVMYNDFVVVGPDGDSAEAGSAATAAEALKAIMDNGGTFYSRGDDSGTNKKELFLWATAGVETPEGDWYLATGQGMGDTLKIASEKQGYTLTDRATFLNLLDALDIGVVYEGSDDLFNQYGVIVVTDATNMEGAQAFSDWITSAEGQAVIVDYGVDTFGEPLFVPNAK
ncbi:MAG: substrate-binding domain-containing protein [Actinomycetota bacterium]|jgi:tungstate transport system substrate-binding protein|nr:substrate-binding domain-containing protein [Actinomycetota bacterium]